MKLPHQLTPGDCFYYRHSIGEEVKCWKVVAIGLNSLIATCENAYLKVPLYYEELAKPEGHFCYVPPQPGVFSSFWSALTGRSADHEPMERVGLANREEVRRQLY
ncbi:hypothetical protein [Telluribacter sp.]|jgi:hypothetical protein|uniref:hypothetical protein n=1 Tax=Telluribacter sp. TaxID=1978767 RepID=UPI002E115807|nr:hypothetical protein [Telluribacter sp.]